MKKFVAVAATLGLIAVASLQATPASATAAGGGVAGCEIVLLWPGAGADGPCDADDGGSLNLPTDGLFAGAAVVDGNAVCAGVCSFSASVDNYGEVCALGEPPLVGTAQGTLSVNGNALAGYQWARAGLTAVIVPTSPAVGAGVAAFLPVPPLPTCAVPAQLQAHVVGLAGIAQP